MESGSTRNGLYIKEGDTADVFAVIENDGWSWFPGCVLQSCDATIRFDETISILNRAPGRHNFNRINVRRRWAIYIMLPIWICRPRVFRFERSGRQGRNQRDTTKRALKF